VNLIPDHFYNKKFQASIHRHAENWFISREVADSSWVGLTREAGDEAFKWVDNTNQDFDNTWAVGGL
jgi:hypothetical protein